MEDLQKHLQELYEHRDEFDTRKLSDKATEILREAFDLWRFDKSPENAMIYCQMTDFYSRNIPKFAN